MVVYNSTLDNELVDFLQVANSLLSKCGIAFKIRSLDDFTADMFVLVFENVLHCKLEEKVEMPHSREDNVHNVQCVIDSLAIDILNIDLSHITGEAVVDGDRQALCNLLEIFAGVAEYLSVDHNVSQITNVSTERADLLNDPDIVTGRGLNAISEEGSTNEYLTSNFSLNLNERNNRLGQSRGDVNELDTRSETKGKRKRVVSREVKSAGGDANMRLASPSFGFSKELSPLAITSPDLVMANASNHLRHAPAFWDLNEAGDARNRGPIVPNTSFGTSAGGDFLTEEPFSSRSAKSETSSKFTGVHPVLTDNDEDEASSSAYGDIGREKDKMLMARLSMNSAGAVSDHGDSASTVYRPFSVTEQANDRQSPGKSKRGAKYAWGGTVESNQSTNLTQANESERIYENISGSGFRRDNLEATNNTSLETRNISIQDSTRSSLFPRPVTSIEINPKANDELDKSEVDFQVVKDYKGDVKKAKDRLNDSARLSKTETATTSKMVSTSTQAKEVPVVLKDSFNDTFTTVEGNYLSLKAELKDAAVQDSNRGANLVNKPELVNRPVSPIESIFEPKNTSCQDASVQCSVKGFRKGSARTSAPSTNSNRKPSKPMPDVFERLYPKRGSGNVSKDSIGNEITARSGADSSLSITGLTLNSASILAENPPPLVITSSSARNESVKGQQLPSERRATDINVFKAENSKYKPESLKLNLVDLSVSADTSNFSESVSKDQIGHIGENREGVMSYNNSSEYDAIDRIQTEEEYEAIRKRLLGKLQQFRVSGNGMTSASGALHRNLEEKGGFEEFGAVGEELRGAPKELSGKWRHVREKLEEETEREKENTESLKRNLAKTFRQVRHAEEHKAIMHQVKLDKIHNDLKSLHKITTSNYNKSQNRKKYARGVIISQRPGSTSRSSANRSSGNRSLSSRKSKTMRSVQRTKKAKDSFNESFEDNSTSRSSQLDGNSTERGQESSRSARVGAKGIPEIGQNEMLSFLLDEFPQLKLSKEMGHVLWKKQLRQMQYLASQAAQESAKLTLSSSDRNALSDGTGGGMGRELKEAERRQGLLMDIMKKEVSHSIRMKERREQHQRETIVKTNVREQKQASARIRRYYDEFQVRMKSRLAKKKSKEEQIFRQLFDEGLEIQKNRIAEIRKYCREKREARTKKQKNEVESLENYYRDQFAILADAVEREKKEVEINDRTQALALEKMKNELRQKLESDIRLLQSQLVENDDAVYFRTLEADKMRKQLQSALFKTQL